MTLAIPMRYTFFNCSDDLVQCSPVIRGTSSARALPHTSANAMHDTVIAARNCNFIAIVPSTRNRISLYPYSRQRGPLGLPLWRRPKVRSGKSVDSDGRVVVPAEPAKASRDGLGIDVVEHDLARP